MQTTIMRNRTASRYSFNEKDLSPSTRRVISEYKHYVEEMHKIEQTFKGKIPKEQDVHKKRN
jgi:hypothetical protein